jgi:hypothetical protein
LLKTFANTCIHISAGAFRVNVVWSVTEQMLLEKVEVFPELITHHLTKFIAGIRSEELYAPGICSYTEKSSHVFGQAATWLRPQG